MARRANELYIGNEYLTIEGRQIKHPALISCYATPTVKSKIRDEPVQLLGLDLETEPTTAELKLIGVWDGNEYQHFYNKDFVEVLYFIVAHCVENDKAIAYWNRLDPFVLYKQLLLRLSPDEQRKSMARYGKIAGVWNKRAGAWSVKPVIEIQIGEEHYFGISNVIRSSMQFFFRRKDDKWLNKVWAYDIACMYQNGIEKEMRDRQYIFGYYSKIAEEAHVIDWAKFDNDRDYMAMVLQSNMLDARAAYDLGMLIQDEFFTAFKHYPANLISQGSLARSAIVATIYNKYLPRYKTEKKLWQKVQSEVQAIGLINYYDEWAERFGPDVLKDLYCLVCESYSGGYIETIRYGYSPSGYFADLTSAYPAVAIDLYDLRGCRITTGTGEPPHIKNSYCFVRGDVNIPLGVNYHPITVKHPIDKATNVRPVGEYRASYTIEERDYLILQGATFNNEVWYNIQTTGKKSPLADCVKTFTDLRTKFLAEGNSAQYMAKIANNSIYGITYEAVDTFDELADGDVIRTGYRAGEFFNPIFAAIITSRTRIKLALAAQKIEDAGGLPILLMTDCVYWQGTADMLPAEMWREKKTLGYFEKPSEYKDLICLGSGRYEYIDVKKGHVTAKRRGLNVEDLHNPDGPEIDTTDDNAKNKKRPFRWRDALLDMANSGNKKLSLSSRVLVSVGMVLHRSDYKIDDLGLIVEERRDVDPVVGRTKRNYDYAQLSDPKLLATTLLDTEPHIWALGMMGEYKLNDQTLPILRDKVMALKVITSAMRKKANNRKSSNTHYKLNSNKLNNDRRNHYQILLAYGYSPEQAAYMRSWGIDRIEEKLREDGLI